MMHPRGEWLNPDTGRVLDRQAFMKEMAAKQVVLLGETHNIAEIHRWQMHVAVYLHACRADMMMGFEMFPRSKQAVLDKWVEGKLRTDEFLEEVEWAKVWGFPPEIYLTLFHFCRQNKVRILALNSYRELVTRAGQDGSDAVPD